MIRLNTPLTEEKIAGLKVGDQVLISGTLYSARDAAHKKLTEAAAKGGSLPFDIDGSVIYYAGPCPDKPGLVMNSCGPTTSYRMDDYAPVLYGLGQRAAIGKGRIGAKVIAAMKKRGGVYFIATGGAGALLSKCMVKKEIVAYPELMAEAVRKIEVVDMPLIVGAVGGESLV